MGKWVARQRLLWTTLPVYSSSDWKYDDHDNNNNNENNDDAADSADNGASNFASLNNNNNNHDYHFETLHSTANQKTSNHNCCVHPAR